MLHLQLLWRGESPHTGRAYEALLLSGPVKHLILDGAVPGGRRAPFTEGPIAAAREGARGGQGRCGARLEGIQDVIITIRDHLNNMLTGTLSAMFLTKPLNEFMVGGRE